MNYGIFALYGFLLFYGCSSQPPSESVLPDGAGAFIRQHFSSDELRHVTAKKPRTADGTFYEAILASRTEIDFGRSGDWIEVKAEEPHHLPTSFFPEAIRSYLESRFAGVGVESIDRDSIGHKVQLSNDLDLFFDSKGVFVRQEQ